MTNIEPHRRALYQGVLVEDVRGNEFPFSAFQLSQAKSASMVTRKAWFLENHFALTTLTKETVSGPGVANLVGALQNPLVISGIVNIEFDTNIQLRMAVASHLIAPTRVLIQLAKSSGISVRRTLALRPNLPGSVQELLAADSAPTVLSALSQNTTVADEWRAFAGLNLLGHSDVNMSALGAQYVNRQGPRPVNQFRQLASV